jgi:hypothetical protein
LRNTIFANVHGGLNIFLPSRTPRIHVTYYSTLDASVPSPFIALQQTCRQIYKETALLPFSSVNTFWFSDMLALDKCKPKFYPAQWDCISHVFFNVSIDTKVNTSSPPPIGNFRKERLEGLSSFKGLKKVTIYLNVDYHEEDKEDLMDGLKTALEGDLEEAVPASVKVVFAHSKVARNW